MTAVLPLTDSLIFGGHAVLVKQQLEAQRSSLLEQDGKSRNVRRKLISS